MAEVMSGYQMNHTVTLGEAPFNRLGNNNSGPASAETKLMINHGATWTSAMVLSVARLVDLEFIPIHMPNQPNAIRLPTMLTNPAMLLAAIIKPIGGVALPPAIEVPEPVVVVTLKATTLLPEVK